MPPHKSIKRKDTRAHLPASLLQPGDRKSRFTPTLTASIQQISIKTKVNAEPPSDIIKRHQFGNETQPPDRHDANIKTTPLTNTDRPKYLRLASHSATISCCQLHTRYMRPGTNTGIRMRRVNVCRTQGARKFNNFPK